MRETSIPVYLRLRDQITDAIIDGTYAEGSMLPSVRAFAESAGVNPLTVAKAYHLFQEKGLVRVQRGVGIFVVEGAAERLRTVRKVEFLKSTWPTVRAQIERLGLDVSALLAEPADVSPQPSRADESDRTALVG